MARVQAGAGAGHGGDLVKSFLLGAKTEVRPALPYDAEVDWLEKTALGPYIDTGVVTKARTDSFALEINMTYDRVHNTRRLHGADNGRFVGCSANSSLWDMGNVSFVYGEFHVVRSEVSANGGWAFSVDGASPYRTGTTTATSEYSTYIFYIATNDSTVARYESVYCRVKDAKVWKNGALVRDLIPVRVGQVGMMYDRVSKQLFGNSGTGAFVVGPDKEVA